MATEKWPAGHFYSVIPDLGNVAAVGDSDEQYMNINYNDESHLTILSELPDVLKDYHFELPGLHELTERAAIITRTSAQQTDDEARGVFRYYQINNSFEWMDGRMLFYFIKTRKPKRIIEVGSGWSTLLMHNTIEQCGLSTTVTCIEPYPVPWLTAMAARGKIELITEKLEHVGTAPFEALEANDICFIDSSHVVKVGSDCLFYINKVFPTLQKGVLVHVHDIFLPFEYPADWHKEGRFWNEQYFLYAFLMDNKRFRVVFGNTYATRFAELKHLQQGCYEGRMLQGHPVDVPFGGGSLWIEVIGPPNAVAAKSNST